MSSSDKIVSPVRTDAPELTFTTASVNAEPVELDSTPISAIDPTSISRKGPKEDTMTSTSAQEREDRAKVLEKRKSNPAVMVDIAQMPSAEELERSGADAVDVKST